MLNLISSWKVFISWFKGCRTALKAYLLFFDNVRMVSFNSVRVTKVTTYIHNLERVFIGLEWNSCSFPNFWFDFFGRRKVQPHSLAKGCRGITCYFLLFSTRGWTSSSSSLVCCMTSFYLWIPQVGNKFYPSF